MQEIILKCPDDFTKEQMSFIKLSALSQISAEIRKTLAIPQADIDACDVKVAEVKEAMGIVEVEEPKKE